jgi:hypothetical protein
LLGPCPAQVHGCDQGPGQETQKRYWGQGFELHPEIVPDEKEAHENDLSLDELYQIRQKDSKPILDDFKQW